MAKSQMVAVVAGCLVEKDGKYLLVQEKQQKVYGQWNIPAGHVDEGETIEQGAIREVREETGFDVELGERIYMEQLSAIKPVKHAFRATIVGGELKYDPDELLDAKWLTLDEIMQLDAEGKIREGWALRVIESQTNGF